MDISSDLTELGKTPVAVVCAGAKSILDIGLTLEYLVRSLSDVLSMLRYKAYCVTGNSGRNGCNFWPDRRLPSILFKEIRLQIAFQRSHGSRGC